ncbi:MAG: hypothetical protein LUF88_13615 [Bacteroides fragilis]|nr:hypothetical protein [Bacteroides fragilis]
MGYMVKIGQRELLESKTVYLDSAESEVILKPDFDKSRLGDIHIMLETDDENKEPRLESVLTDGDLHFKCINFNNPLGIGTSKMTPIGHLEGKKIYLHLWIYNVGSVGTKKIDINLFRENA